MSKIKTVAIVGGTHGNEFSGIYLLRKWQQPTAVVRDSFSVETVFANPKAHDDNKRYVDHDLNRQFSLTDLANNDLASYEQSRAKVINQQIGPKGDARVDFIIDLHNTTSNMGPCLILLQSDSFNRQMGHTLKCRCLMRWWYLKIILPLNKTISLVLLHHRALLLKLGRSRNL